MPDTHALYPQPNGTVAVFCSDGTIIGAASIAAPPLMGAYRAADALGSLAALLTLFRKEHDHEHHT